MSITDYLVAFIGIILSVWFNLLCYKSVSSNKNPILNIKTLALILIESAIIYISTTFNKYTLNIVIVNIISLIILFCLVFKEKKKTAIIKGILVYASSIIFELLVSIAIVPFPSITEALLNQNVYIKTMFSIIVLLLTYLFLNVSFINKTIMKVDKLSQKTKEIILIILIFIAFIILDLRFIDALSRDVYFSNIFLVLSFIFLVVSSLYNANKVKTEIEKTECLLEIMTKYEKIIDEDSVNRHEMYNNLLILKSHKDKNSKRYNEILEDLIKIYNRKGSECIKNMDKLPTGLKGIIYYKIKSIAKYDINLDVHISQRVREMIKLIDAKDYIRLCKLTCIAFDNAIEATIVSEKKLLIIDIYKENDKIVVTIENSFNNNIDISKINNKYYSTKGKNRGLGLYIAKKFVEDSTNIAMKQETNNDIFTTKIELNVMPQ